MASYGVLWLLAMILFIVIECFSYQLMSIWMAVGALSALIAYGLGADFVVQFIIFIVVSLALIVITRPFAERFLNAKNTKTNVDSIPGKKAIVIKTIDNLKNSGTVKLDGMEWSAKSENGEIISEGEAVEILRVEGVKAIVRKEKGE